MAGRTARIAEPHRLVLVLDAPAVILIGRGHQRLVAVDFAGKIRRCALRRLVEEHEVLHALDVAGQLFNQRQQGGVDKDYLVLGVVDNIGQLTWEQPNVQGVHDRARARRAEVELQMLEIVPSEGTDAVARLHAQPLQHVAQPLHPPVKVAVGVDVHRAVGLFGLDLFIGIEAVAVFQDAVNRERVVHHQAGQHAAAPCRLAVQLEGERRRGRGRIVVPASGTVNKRWIVLSSRLRSNESADAGQFPSGDQEVDLVRALVGVGRLNVGK